MEIIQTDKAFKNSPDAGDPECTCSRCGKQIPEDDAPITRMFSRSDNAEYRYCRSCEAGIDKSEISFEDYKAELIKMAAGKTSLPSHEIKINDEAARQWYESGISAFYCFREEW